MTVAAQSEVEKTSTVDPVLDCIRFLARAWRKSDSVATLTAGLPIEHGRMDVRLMAAAFARIGVTVRNGNEAPQRLKQYDFPVILFPGNRAPLVLLSRLNRRTYRAYDPLQGSEVNLDAKDIDARQQAPLMFVSPDFQAVQEHSGVRMAQQGHWFWSAVRGHAASAIYVLLAAAFINVFAIAFPLFTMNVYDRVLPNSAQTTLWVLAIGVGMVSIFDLLLKLARAGVIEFVGRSIDFKMSSALFDRVLNTPMSSRPASTGAFVSRIGQYEVLREFVAASTLVMFVDVLFLGIFAYVLTLLVGWLVIFPLIAGVAALVITLIVGILSGRAVKSALAESSARNSVLVEALTGAQTVKASRAEGQLLRRWEAAVLASSNTQDKLRAFQAMATNTTATLSQLSLVGIIVGGSYAFTTGDVTTGAIIAAMMLSNRLIAPIGMIAGTLLRARAAVEAYQTVDGIMKLPDERPTRVNQMQRVVQGGKITFNKVRFAYPQSKVFVLDGISFAIEPGEKIGIIGRIGSGKTTIGRLLVNFHRASEGEVSIDGIDIDQYHPEDLRRAVGLVIQDPEIFNGTVRENILMSDPAATEERLMTAARRAGVEDFVSRHPQGYDMPVGERGVLLSGGQRQAIALARAMLVEPKVMFLDEPSSSMDLATERQLIKHLESSLMPDQTVLIATHRYSLLSLVTRLMVIDNGKLIADGPKDKVLEQLRMRADAQ
ncbi:type I secretion system permease/ATPase [Devosia sp. XJ19-1]|uniref:Type I secretion system permease/ATPase n=1 Tax=Devosia ureilytica TaxID=2952754 RepID=A0A9Q4AR24_9HYPH|nr:type I secretion system permease/ATPase [Devosia ureilytica]MCP8884491.1 type I secretion system permease/ATPase [Devosia ureilytica]MCP8888121.1 type I secretion system permease/ATPase [Devosia ureilytica]